jgi:polyphosphate kinase
MPRNLDRRVELLFPVESMPLKKRVKQILEVCFRDNVKARTLQPDGSWIRRAPRPGETAVRSQQLFYDEAREHAAAGEPANRKEFSVRRKPAE